MSVHDTGNTKISANIKRYVVDFPFFNELVPISRAIVPDYDSNLASHHCFLRSRVQTAIICRPTADAYDGKVRRPGKKYDADNPHVFVSEQYYLLAASAW